MSKFMRGCLPAKSASNHPIATISTATAHSSHLPAITTTNSIYTIVNDDKINVQRAIKRLSNLVTYSANCVVKIVAIGVLTIYAMNHRVAPCVGFKAEGHVPVSICAHLIAEKSLNLTDRRFHRIDHFLAKWPVIGQEVDHPHRARFANVQVKRLLACGVEAIACAHVFVIENLAEMHIVLCGWLRRSPPDRREAEQRENAGGQFGWDSETVHGCLICLNRGLPRTSAPATGRRLTPVTPGKLSTSTSPKLNKGFLLWIACLSVL